MKELMYDFPLPVFNSLTLIILKYQFALVDM